LGKASTDSNVSDYRNQRHTARDTMVVCLLQRNLRRRRNRDIERCANVLDMSSLVVANPPQWTNSHGIVVKLDRSSRWQRTAQ
jgi:hypothetical protein